MDYRPEDQMFWDDPGPDPDDRFNRFFAALILAAVACGIVAYFSWRLA